MDNCNVVVKIKSNKISDIITVFNGFAAKLPVGTSYSPMPCNRVTVVLGETELRFVLTKRKSHEITD